MASALPPWLMASAFLISRMAPVDGVEGNLYRLTVILRFPGINGVLRPANVCSARKHLPLLVGSVPSGNLTPVEPSGVTPGKLTLLPRMAPLLYLIV